MNKKQKVVRGKGLGEKSFATDLLFAISDAMVDDLSKNFYVYGLRNKIELDRINDKVMINASMVLRNLECDMIYERAKEEEEESNKGVTK